MRQFGAPEAEIETARQQWYEEHEEALQKFEVYPENCTAFLVFWSLRDHWEMPGDGSSRCCIPRSDVESTLRMMGIRRPAEIQDTFDRLQVLVDAARPHLLHKAAEAIRSRTKQ